MCSSDGRLWGLLLPASIAIVLWLQSPVPSGSSESRDHLALNRSPSPLAVTILFLSHQPHTHIKSPSHRFLAASAVGVVFHLWDKRACPARIIRSQMPRGCCHCVQHPFYRAGIPRISLKSRMPDPSFLLGGHPKFQQTVFSKGAGTAPAAPAELLKCIWSAGRSPVSCLSSRRYWLGGETGIDGQSIWPRTDPDRCLLGQGFDKGCLPVSSGREVFFFWARGSSGNPGTSRSQDPAVAWISSVQAEQTAAELCS